MCRVVIVNSRCQFPVKFRVRSFERRYLCYQRVVVGYLDKCRRIGCCRVRDAGVHVG
jgi:hypothetical protein